MHVDKKGLALRVIRKASGNLRIEEDRVCVIDRAD